VTTELTTREIQDSLYAELITLVYKQNVRAFVPLTITIALMTYLLSRTIETSLALTALNSTCIAVWMHSRAATLAGPGLIASDLPLHYSQVMQELMGMIAVCSKG